MSNGRHFNPPTPAYRPRDPFSNATPRLAEYVPSCETTRPPPSRPRPVRMDGNSPISVPIPAALKADLGPRVVPPASRSALAVEVQHLPAPAKAPKVAPAAEPAREAMAPPRPEPPREEARAPRSAPRPAAAPPPATAVPPAPVVREEAREARKKTPLPAAPQREPAREQREPEEAKAKKVARAKEERPVEEAKAKPATIKAPKAKASEQAELTPGPGEEVRICEWEKCGKKFTVKVTGRTVVRRYCSGTCRGRASEARTGKR